MVNQARGGDERAFEEILRRYSPQVFRIASKFFRQRDQIRMWRAASALVSTMGILLVILTGFTIFSARDSQMPPTDVVASQNLYSPEYVVLDRGDLDDDELANDQLIPTIYDLEDSDGQ